MSDQPTPETNQLLDCDYFNVDEDYATANAYKRMAEHAKDLERQRDGAFSLIDYAGELLGVPKQEHKSAHGFKILQAIKDLIEANKQVPP